MKIYTRTGDDGSTGLFSGGRVAKTHPRIEACGTIDELNSHLGVAASSRPAEAVAEALRTVQNDLFSLGADLASCVEKPSTLSEESVAWLEGRIDSMTAELEPLRNFILPGGSPAAAHIHVARAVCRRAERRVIAIEEDIPAIAKTYLNRLSDYLFTLARYENHLQGVAEPKWITPGPR
jgi:cob(I)alamin adenosyltransferase